MPLKSTSVKYSNNLKIFIPLFQQYYTGDIAYENNFKYTENVILNVFIALIFKNNIKNHETAKNLFAITIMITNIIWNTFDMLSDF